MSAIPRSRIFYSRDTSLYRDLMRETNNRGVDIVLSALPGKLLHASWKCVAPGRKMSDIGKRDVLGHAILPLSSFDQARSIYTTDSLQVMQSNLDQGKGATSATEIVEPYADFLDREVVHASRITCFDAADAASAFRYMQNGKHIGKIVIRMPEDPADLPTATSLATPEFSSERAYLLSGGLGELGQTIARWMAGIYGSPSQANYAAANTFLVGLAKCRHSLGQPASVLDLGPIAEIGYVSRQPKLQRDFDNLGVRYVREQDLLNVVHLLIKHSKDPALLQNFAVQDPHHLSLGAIYSNHSLHDMFGSYSTLKNMDSTTKTKDETSDKELTDFISKIHASPAMLDQPEAVVFIIRKIGTSLMPMDLKRGVVPDLAKLSLFPIDSLVAIELRAWARNRLNVEVKLIEISSIETVKGFSQLIIDHVKEKLRVLAE